MRYLIQVTEQNSNQVAHVFIDSIMALTNTDIEGCCIWLVSGESMLVKETPQDVIEQIRDWP